ncbi:MAG TPA: tRNA lysidine(34) synthetase TilS [Longilinea sp.]|nr:tRNA lysidine(34) synthetase TilS [Longilinea sp.]
MAEIKDTAFTKCGLNHGQTLLVGVSGGPDSLCLLDGLCKLGFHLIAAYFNHQLRPEADDELRHVQDIAEKMGVRFISGSENVIEFAQIHALSIEAAARELRYRFLFSSARALNADAVAVGHNANDQVETVLMHILRGSGLDGLSGMAFRSLTAWDEQIPLVRPLLKTSRAEILEYCDEAGLIPVVDSSNLEPVFLRNRIRLDLLPKLEELAPGVTQRIWNLSRLAATDLQIMKDLEEQAWNKCILFVEDTRVLIDLKTASDQADGLQARLIRRAAAHLRPSGESLDLENTMRAVEYIHMPKKGRTIELAQNLILTTDGKVLKLSRREYQANLHQYPSMGDVELAVADLPCRLDLGDGWSLFFERASRPPADNFKTKKGELQLEAWLDEASLSGLVSVRRPLAGDRLRPLGMARGSQKLSDFLINRHIPVDARRTWPIVYCAGEIAWVPGFAPAHPFRVRPETEACIYITIVRKQ